MRISTVIIIVLLLITAAGCSGGQNALMPEADETSKVEPRGEHHRSWGLWQFVANPEAGTLDVVKLRTNDFHLNALPFLEPPPFVNLTLESVEFNGNIVDVDIGLRHPFLGLTEFTGFDVCGILITNGSITGFDDPDLRITGEGDTRLLNPDGYSRWWNPHEFPINNGTIFSYTDGLLGAPDSYADYNSTLNAYKYFCDDLEPNDPVDSITTVNRGMFSAGQKNIRHYTIEIGDEGLIFNYAVDACWKLPTGNPPYQAPGDFPPNANRPEAFFIDPQVVSNTLWYKDGDYGGELSLDIYVYDWFDADENLVRVECPGVFSPTVSSTPTGGGQNYSVYHVEMTSPTLESSEDIYLLITAECPVVGYQGLLEGKPISAYAPLKVINVGTQTDFQILWHDEGLVHHSKQASKDDIDPALVIDGTGTFYLGFFWWQEQEDSAGTWWFSQPVFAESHDSGLTFGNVSTGGWQGHKINIPVFCYDLKMTLGSDGHCFSAYRHHSSTYTNSKPAIDPWLDSCSSGISTAHCVEFLYTSEGYPMLFVDRYGEIKMRIGPIPNVAGTGTWPSFKGTEYILADDGYLSKVRSGGKTSDGRCHLMYWSPTVGRMINHLSTDDISGHSWPNDDVIFSGSTGDWEGATDPSLWIDENDGFHTFFGADTSLDQINLMYGYSSNGTNWDFTDIAQVPESDGLNETGVVVFDALDMTFVWICYETDGNVYCRYKQISSSSFSEAIQVNVHTNATLPDLYPNDNGGIVFAYEADGDGGTRDIFWRLAEIIE